MNTRHTSRHSVPKTATLLLLASLLALGNLSLKAAVPPPAGVAPTTAPAGGLAIDGNLITGTPVANIGDWIIHTNVAPPGTAGAVLDKNGIPLDITRTFHLIDPYNSTSDSTFTGGNKWFDNPNIWTWTTAKASSKTDINNVLMHVGQDVDGHVWVAISADRFSTSGDSYIDFEFLQNRLTKNSNGTFVSAGPHGGRTVNDLLISLAFISGGNVPDFYVSRWQTNNSGGYAYVDVTSLLPAGRVFVALNTTTIPVPYGAFGATNYAPNAFVEGAADLTALLSTLDPCLGLGVDTIMVKTKTSASSTATISDFIDPIYHHLTIGPSANAGADQARCTEGASTAFPLQGAATSGFSPIASTTWSVLSGTATIEDPSSLITTAHVSSATATLRLSVVQSNMCTEMDSIVLTVKPLPTCSITGPALVCPRLSAQFNAPTGMTAYAWSISGNGAISGSSTQRTVNVTAGTACGANFTLNLTVMSNGCPSSCTTDVLVNDTTPPIVTCPTNRMLECPADTRTNVTGVATATDSCGGPIAIVYADEVTNGCSGSKVIARTWTATDQCGNSASCVQTITVRDTIKPTIVCPTNRVVECPGDTSPAATGMATAQDGCGGLVTINFNDSVTNNCGGTRVISRLWTATDECGNVASCAQTITVRDTTKPTIVCPANVTLDCPADTSTNATGVATSMDLCGAVTIRYTDAVTNRCGGTKVIARTWTATDECSNSISCVQTITVRDITNPTIQCPADVVLECPAVTTTNVTGVATAQDGCGTVTISFADAVTTNCAATKVIARTWTATDQCGNVASCVQTITVRDITKPTIICPADRVLECPAVTTTNATGVATASDGCGAVTIRYSDDVTTNCGGTKIIARTWTATDVCGNVASCVQTITVRDTIKPTITCPANVTLECPADTRTNVTGVATATDGCGSVSISYSDSVSNNCAGTKVIARTWTATDACGNASSCVQTITVRDTLKPTIVCPANIVLECPADTRTNVTGVASSVDACGTATITYSDSVSNNCGGTKVISRTWTAADECGNSATCVQTITVRDTIKPTIQCPASVVLECPAVTTTNVTGVATAQDGCGAVTITYADAVTNNCGGTKIIARTWTATDACGNSASCVQTITVRDTIKPTITAPANVVLECPATNTGTNATGVATGQDGCGAITIRYSDAVTTNCGGTRLITRTWTATDACGNSESDVQTITVRDTTPPNITAPSDRTLDCPANTATNATGVATATDGCGSVTITYSDSVNNNCGGTKVITRTWTATDQCGNTRSAVQTITVRDITPPTVTAPAHLTVECGASTAPSATGTATGTDACGSVTIGFSDSVSNNCGGSRVISRTWTATDQCGNSVSALQTITVRDTTRPSMTLPADRVLQCPGDTRTSVTGVPVVQDVCGSATVTYSDTVTTNCAQTKTVLRLWTAVDQCGNATNGLQTITVIDTTKPTLTPPNISVQCDRDVPAPYTNLAAFRAAGGTATDACSPSALTFALISDSGLVGSCPGTVTRVYRLTDECGNVAESTQRITVDDTIAPVLRCPTNMTVECGTPFDPANLGGLTATDNCDTNVDITFSDTPVLSEYNLSFLVADPDLNTGPYGPTYLKFAPANLPCPESARLTGRALDPLRNAVAYATNGQQDALTSIGNVPMAFGQIVPYEMVIQVSGGRGPERGAIEFTCDWSTYTTSNDRFGYDTNYMVYCAFVDPADPGSIDPNLNAKVDSYSSVVINRGTIEEKIRGTFRVSGLDTGDRVIVEIWVVLMSTMPDHVGGTVAADFVSAQKASVPPVEITVGNQTDSLGNLGKIFPMPPPQPQPPLGPLPTQPPIPPGVLVSVFDRTWAATDDCGNRSTCNQRITVRDSKAPNLVAPPNVVLECPATAGTGTNVTGVATDPLACGPVQITYSDVVSTGCAGTKVITRTWTAIDESNLSTNVVQTITVRDSTPPTVTAPADLVLECPAVPSTNVTGVAMAQDGCGSVSLSFSDAVAAGCGNSRVITRTWTATDSCGNSANAVQTITIADTTPPTITCPANRTLECSASIDPTNTGSAAGQDSCGTVTITFADAVAPSGPGRKTITRTWTATDACGLTASCVQRIELVDTTPPSVSCPPNRVLGCPANTDPANTGTATALDACGSATVSFTDSVTTGAGGTMTILRTWKATDEAGLIATCVQRIEVADTTAPTITCPADKVLECPANTAPANTGVAAATDTCGTATVTFTDAVTAGLAGTRTILRTWKATDQVGLTATCVQRIQVVDTTAPSITCPQDRVLECPADTDPANTGNATASDACGAADVTFTDAVTPGCGGTRTILRTWLATDEAGLTASCVQRIEVRDTTAPVMTCPANRSVAAGDTWSFGQPSATDNCGAVAIVALGAVTNSTGSNTFMATQTWRASDACGNTATCQQTVTVINSNQGTFDVADEGWRVAIGEEILPPTYVPQGGQSGGYIMANDAEVGNGWYWLAPPKYRVDQSAYYDGQFQFSLMQTSTTYGPRTNDVVLSGAGLTLVLSLQQLPGTSWTSYSVWLNEQAGWWNSTAGRPATQAELITVLSTLTNLMIRGDYTVASGVGALDSVGLVPSTGTGEWKLEIRKSFLGGLMLRWPALATGFQLEESDTIVAPNWRVVPATPSVKNGMYYIWTPTTIPVKFFRLHKPTP